MTPPTTHRSEPGDRRKTFWWVGLGTSLAIAVLLSPFASPNPDGLDRVAQDHGFESKAIEDAPATRLPFAQIFDEYALRGVPTPLATPLAGLAGTLAAFGLAWGAGRLLAKKSSS
jgi:cobalt/nickel transport protein